MGTKNEFEDDEDSYRPLEPHEQQELSEKRLERLDSRVNRMEGLLETISLVLKKILSKITRRDTKKTPEEANTYKIQDNLDDERSKFLETRHKKTSKDIEKLSKQELDITREVKRRRKQDRWYGLVMMDCRFKISEMDNKITCSKTHKRCNYKNCPLKDEVKELTA